MSASVRDLEHAAHVQFLRVQKAKQKKEEIQHALNLVFNFVFETFHMALTVDGPVHDVELGTVKNVPVGNAESGSDLHILDILANARMAAMDADMDVKQLGLDSVV